MLSAWSLPNQMIGAVNLSWPASHHVARQAVKALLLEMPFACKCKVLMGLSVTAACQPLQVQAAAQLSRALDCNSKAVFSTCAGTVPNQATGAVESLHRTSQPVH